MSKTLTDHIDQICPIRYWVTIKRSDLDSDAELLLNNVAFSGYDIQTPDPLQSKVYASVKAKALEADPLSTNNGKFPIQISFIDEGVGRMCVIYDSQGLSEEIIANNLFERERLDEYNLDAQKCLYWKDKQNNYFWNKHLDMKGEVIDPELLHIPDTDQRCFTAANREEFERLAFSREEKVQGVSRMYVTRDLN